jgi:hypothetical protein
MMQESIRNKLIPDPRHRARFRNNSDSLQYYNPYSYPDAGEAVTPNLEGIIAVMNKCVGYETTPLTLRHKTRLGQDMHAAETAFSTAVGVKKEGDIMYRALITWSMEENMLGTNTLRYWVISPFIWKERANSAPPFPSALTDYCAIRTNNLKTAVREVLSYPAMTLDTVMAYCHSDIELMLQHVLETDQEALNQEVVAFLHTVYDQDNKAALVEWFAHALNGNIKGCIPARESLVERAKKHLEDIEPLHEQINEANLLTPVFVSQFGDDDVARCYTVQQEDAPEHTFSNPAGVIDKLVVHKTASAMPSVIKSKLATLQINEANMESRFAHYGYKYIPNVGALMQDTFFNTGGRHGMVLLNPSELIEIFPNV